MAKLTDVEFWFNLKLLSIALPRPNPTMDWTQLYTKLYECQALIGRTAYRIVEDNNAIITEVWFVPPSEMPPFDNVVSN